MAHSPAQLKDAHGRTLNYLRISLTDRCNFRCIYCMPPEGIPLLPRESVLRIEEFERLARIFASLGITKIRLTGGEPLLRHKIVSLVSALSRVEGVDQVTLTTNGTRLAELVEPLAEAGLASVNASLDSMNEARFSRITRGGDLKTVLFGIQRAMAIGLPLKINVVALDDLSQQEVGAFCALAEKHPLEVRFIELMPLCGSAWRREGGLSMSTLRHWVEARTSLQPLSRGSDPAQAFAVSGGRGRIGFICSMSEPFCGSCNRIRLSAVGGLRLCLFSTMETDLRKRLRNGSSDDEIAEHIRSSVWGKPKGQEEFKASQWKKENSLPYIRSIGG